MMSILIPMLVGVTEISGFSYLDSLSSRKPPASDLPTTTTTPKTSGYLDSLEGTPSEAAVAMPTAMTAATETAPALATETPNEEYGQNTVATTMTNDVVMSGKDVTGEGSNPAAVVAAAATSAYFLEQYNTQNTFAATAKRKKRTPQEATFFQPPTTQDASKMEEARSSAELATAVETSPDNDEMDMSETQKLMKKVKEAGTAGVISYALWELGFWALSVPVCFFAYYQYTGHWPDLSDAEDQKKLGAEAFAFVNVARFAVPLRIGLALGTTPWIDENIVQRFANKGDDDKDK
jgi:hypothetical protein